MYIPRCYNSSSMEMTWDEFTIRYPGLQFGRCSPAPGSRYFRLVKIEETMAPATLHVTIGDLSGIGKPITGQLVGLYWPNPEVTIPIEAAGSKWKPYVAAVQRTDANGQTGFGLGGQSWMKPSVGGPYACWVLSSFKSDALMNMGWIPGTVHQGPMRLTFRLMDAGDEPPPPPPTEPEWRKFEVEIGDQMTTGRIRTWPAETVT